MAASASRMSKDRGPRDKDFVKHRAGVPSLYFLDATRTCFWGTLLWRPMASGIASIAAPTAAEGHSSPRGRYLATLSIAALGVVYGDIGTSPLYALRECFHEAHGMAVTPANVYGVLSLIFWS